MNGCVWEVGVECDGVASCLACDASSELSCIDENVPSWARWALASLPCLGEESLAFEVLVKLVGELDLYVSEYALDDFLKIFWHFCLGVGRNVVYLQRVTQKGAITSSRGT